MANRWLLVLHLLPDGLVSKASRRPDLGSGAALNVPAAFCWALLAGRTTLGGEGCSTRTMANMLWPLPALNCWPHDPAFAGELAW